MLNRKVSVLKSATIHTQNQKRNSQINPFLFNVLIASLSLLSEASAKE
jgi:hypothetical protein